MVLAAADARRVGIHRPLSEALLIRLHAPYLAARGGERLRPEPVPDALAWATRPLYATSSLLIPSDGGVRKLSSRVRRSVVMSTVVRVLSLVSVR